jgi:parallel beta-helix repeat protein
MKNSNTECPSVLVRIAVGMLLAGGCSQIVCVSREMATVRGGHPAAGVAQTKEEVLYVSVQGSDAWSGRLPEPNAAKTDGPFATLERARNAIRSTRSGTALRTPVGVYVRGGVYALSAPLVFLPEDSGTPEAPITYASCPGEEVILSGGRVITGWKKAPSPAAGQNRLPGLWTAEVPGVKEGEWYFHQLFVNGERRQRARAPNTGLYRADGQFLPGDPSRFKFRPGDIHAAWAEEGDVEVVGLEKWAEFRLPLTAVDAATNTAALAAARQEFGDDKDARYWVENAADALDAPGEWRLDRRAGTLSYLAMPGEDMSRAQFTASFLPQLIRLEGNEGSDDPVHDIILRDFTFAYADWQLPAKGYADMQAAFDIPAAVELRCAQHCRIERCTFAHLGQYALEIHHGSKDVEVLESEMTDLGAGGVKIGDPEIPKETAQTTSGIVVSHNHIHNLGIVYPAAVGVWIGQSSGNTVAHNEIADTYYTAISLGWTWGYGPTAAHHNRIEFNNLHNLGRGLLSDMGCIYSLGVQPGTVERNNLCHDVTRYDYGGWGLYTDEGSSQILLENNIVYRTQDGGFHQHYGRENIVRNNIFALGDEAQLRRTREEAHRSFTFEHNIVYWEKGKLLDGAWTNGQFLFDHNLYWQAAGQPIEFGKDSMTEWQRRGQDVHSLVADPLFTDPARGAFTLKPGSPASKIGFQPIDMSQIGRTARRRLPQTQDP